MKIPGGGRYIPGSERGGGQTSGTDPFTGTGRYVPQYNQNGSSATPYGADPFTGKTPLKGYYIPKFQALKGIF